MCGILLLLLGLLGFISNPLIGVHALFAADAAHNVLHLVLGIILLSAALWSRIHVFFWLKAVGTLLGLLGLVGLLTLPSTGGALLGIVYTNGAYNWFHLVLGVAMVIIGVYEKRAA